MTENETEEVKKTKEEKREDRIAWIRFVLIHAAVLIPLVVGLACLIGGTNSNNHTVAFAGKIVLEAVVPGVMAILIAALLIWKFRGVRKLDTTADKATEGTPSQREREQQAIDAVNSTYGFASRANMADYEAESIAEGMRHAPKWGLPVGLTCFFSLFALLIVATVLLIKRVFVGAIVCAAIVGVVLITTFIVMAVSRVRATNGDIRKAKKITEGKVKACFMVGTTTTKSGGIPHGNGGTVRIQSVTYRVIVIADGKEYGAFSKQFYETGESVTIAVMGKNRAKIAEDSELKKIKFD